MEAMQHPKLAGRSGAMSWFAPLHHGLTTTMRCFCPQSLFRLALTLWAADGYAAEGAQLGPSTVDAELPEAYVFREAYVDVTPAYSNAVLEAVLPHVSAFIERSGLPVRTPLTRESVREFGCDWHRGETGGTVVCTNGFAFGFTHGHVSRFRSPKTYFDLQNPEEVPRYYGVVRLTEPQAVDRVRKFVLAAGYSLEDTFIAWPPAETRRPGRVGANRIPRIELVWEHPVRKVDAATFEVNLETGQVESMFLLNPNLYHPPPRVVVEATTGRAFGGASPLALSREYASTALPGILDEANERARKAGMEPPGGWTVADVAEWHGEGTNQWVWLSARLKDGWTVHWKKGVVVGVTARGAFFSKQGAVRVQDYVGRWRVSNGRAIKAARAALMNAGYAATALGFQNRPTLVRRPHFTGAAPIPRVQIHWDSQPKGKPQDSTSVAVEYDMDAGKVMSFRIIAAKLSAPLPDVGIPMH